MKIATEFFNAYLWKAYMKRKSNTAKDVPELFWWENLPRIIADVLCIFVFDLTFHRRFVFHRIYSSSLNIFISVVGQIDESTHFQSVFNWLFMQLAARRKGQEKIWRLTTARKESIKDLSFSSYFFLLLLNGEPLNTISCFPEGRKKRLLDKRPNKKVRWAHKQGIKHWSPKDGRIYFFVKKYGSRFSYL